MQEMLENAEILWFLLFWRSDLILRFAESLNFLLKCW